MLPASTDVQLLFFACTETTTLISTYNLGVFMKELILKFWNSIVKIKNRFLRHLKPALLYRLLFWVRITHYFLCQLEALRMKIRNYILHTENVLNWALMVLKISYIFYAKYNFLYSFLYFEGEKWSKHVLDMLCEIHPSTLYYSKRLILHIFNRATYNSNILFK